MNRLRRAWAEPKVLTPGGCSLTGCGVALRVIGGGPWARHVAPLLDAVSAKGTSLDQIDGLARLGPLCPTTLEIAIPLAKGLFTPNDDAPPPARTTPRGAVAEAAAALCQGANVAL